MTFQWRKKENKIFSNKSAKSSDASKSSSTRKSKKKVKSLCPLTCLCPFTVFCPYGSSKGSYFVVLEKRETAEHAKLLVDQIEKKSKRTQKILEKSLKLEKEKSKMRRLKQGVWP